MSPEEVHEAIQAQLLAARKMGRAGKPMGLGDRVAAVSKAIGIKLCAGCKKRQEVLNRLGEKIGL